MIKQAALLKALSWVSTSDEKWMILLTGKVMLQDEQMKLLYSRSVSELRARNDGTAICQLNTCLVYAH